jgi:hypothetical protein
MAANVNGERWVNKGADAVVAACRAHGFKLRMATKPKPGVSNPAPEFDVGRVLHAGMPAFLQGLSVFCQPSVAEGCSNSIQEAMACGLPCIVCRESGYHGEACMDGRQFIGGEVLFVPPYSPEAVLEALLYLAENPGHAARIGTNARRFALAHSWGSVAAKFNHAFQEAARFKPSPPESRPFHLVTVATASYADCLRTMLPTWVRNAGAASITVLSDAQISGLPDGVEVHVSIRSARSWVDGCLAKAQALAQFGLHPRFAAGERVLFLDADCAVLRPLNAFASTPGDLVLTRFSPDASAHPRSAGTCSSGAFAFTINTRTMVFLQLWSKVQALYADAGHGTTPGKVAADQYALTDLARGRACGISVRNLDEHVWNNAPARSDEAWIADLAARNSAVAHFKGGRWKNPALVSRIVGDR